MDDRPTADWIPSHVEITIHQARDLLLKNKNANSELYVSIQVEKDKITTGLIPRDTAPQWNFVSEIPLMSLDTTVHLTVRQKGRLGDQFIGHIPIPLRNFSVSSKVVTHWYKLGSRPGKVKNKLRGDLQVSIKFLSNWNALSNGTTPHLGESTFDPNSPSLSHRLGNGKHSGRMLNRSKSEMRVKVRDVMATNLLDSKSPSTQSPTTVRDRLSSAIRRSFRKKTKTPVLVFQECEDDFTFSPSPTRTPVLKKRSNTVSSFLYPHSDSDSTCGTSSEVNSQSPGAVYRPSTQAQATAGSSTAADSVAREGESSGDIQEEANGGASAVRLREKGDKRSEWQKSGRRRWTMNTLPLLSTTPTSNSSHVPGLSASPSPSPFANSDASQSLTTEVCNGVANGDEDAVLTYRAKFNHLAVSPRLRRSSDRLRSFSITSSQGSVRSALLVEQESISECCSGAATPTLSIRRNLKDHSNGAESGYNTGSSGLLEGGGSGGGDGGINSVGKSPVISEESGSEAGSSAYGKLAKQSKASQRTVTPPVGTKRSRPLTRRNTSAVSNPSRSRVAGNHHQSRTSTSSDSRGVTPVRGHGGGGAGNHSLREGTPRKKTLSPPSSTPNRKLLPATPVRRSEKAHLAATRPKSLTASSPSTTTPTPTTGETSLPDSNEGSTPSQTNEVDSRVTGDDLVNKESPTSANEEATQLSSKEGGDSDKGVPNTSGMKNEHTAAYKDTSPSHKDGFEPLSVFPPAPSSEYQSQTLPLRGKQARRRHTEKALSKGLDVVEVYSVDGGAAKDHTLPVATDSTHWIKRSPQNIKFVHRSSMNYVLGGNPTKTPPTTIDLDETDGAVSLGGDSVMMDGVCSKTSITSFSSTCTSTSSRPSTPSTPKYGTKTPGEIVTSALRNKSRPVGGLKKTIMMYQENRKELRKSLQENKHYHRSCFLEELAEDSDKQQLLEPGERKERACSSAGSSPQQLRRNRSAAETLTGLLKNPFNSLRRSRSSVASSKAPSSRPMSMVDMGDLGISPDLLERLNSKRASQSNTSLEPVDPTAHLKTSAPALLAYRTAKPMSAKARNSKISKTAMSEPIIRVRTPSMTESSSVKTLTELDASWRENAVYSNPAGASPMSVSGIGGSGHSRHTTCSSVDSEGFVSMTGEELTLEELSHQDMSHWSKEDLYKELILSKQALRRKDQELKDIKGYLDNLLLRIMETNPSLLSSAT